MKSFVYYRLPDQKEIYKKEVLGSTSLYWEDLDLSKHKGFLFSPFDSKQKIILLNLGKEQEIEARSIRNRIFAANEDFENTKHHYTNLVQSAISTIQNSALQKVVLAQNFIIKKRVEPLEIFHEMCSSYPHGFIYLVTLNDVSWVGTSPEMLCRFSNGIGETVALAGTQDKKGKGWGNKEKEEQGFIQSYIEEELSKIDNFSFSKKNTRTIRAGDIEHISSLYKFNTNILGLNKLVKKLHPTPAVCGYPKRDAQEFISTNETFNREYYSGFLGLNEEKDTNLFVNLRCAKLENNRTTIYAGAGITKDSIPENEWIEILKKIKTVMSL